MRKRASVFFFIIEQRTEGEGKEKMKIFSRVFGVCLQPCHLLQRVEASIRKHFNGIAVQVPARIAPHAPTNAPPRPPDARTHGVTIRRNPRPPPPPPRTDAKFHFTCGTHHQDRVSGMEGEGGGSRPRFVCREMRARTQVQKKRDAGGGEAAEGGGRESVDGAGGRVKRKTEETKAKH